MRRGEPNPRASGHVERIPDGDLTVELHERSERNTISRALMNMRTSLRDQMGDIGNAANILASSASKIFVTTRKTAAAAAQMAGAVSETTTTVEEVKQTSHLSNQKAERVAAGTKESVSEGIAQFREAGETIGHLTTTGESAAAAQGTGSTVPRRLLTSPNGDAGHTFCFRFW